jgi:hypothetical protein
MSKHLSAQIELLPKRARLGLHCDEGAVKRHLGNRDVPLNLHPEVIMFKFIVPAIAIDAALSAPGFPADQRRRRHHAPK